MKKMCIGLFALLLAVSFCLAGCGKNAPVKPLVQAYEETVDGVKFFIPAVGDSISQLTQQQADCVKSFSENGNYHEIAKYAQGIWENSQPEPVKLSWTADTEGTVSDYTVTVSEMADMTDAFFKQTTAATEIGVYNLKLGTTYYWTVTVNLDDKAITSDVMQFTTDDMAPRNLRVDGVSNVRDLGGWKTEDGGSVRQGMIYRCGRLNVSNIDSLKLDITEDGIHTLRDVLGVKTEIDVREDEEAVFISESPLGSDVDYYRFPMTWDANILEENAEAIRQTFALLAREENYPMILHCNIGTDRTGLLCFLVNALLGVSETDLCIDYMFSNFAAIKGNRTVDTIQEDYLTVICQAPGDTLSQQTYNYLAGIGVPTEQLDEVIRILKDTP